MLGLMSVLLVPLGESLERIYVESQVRKIAGELARTQPNLKPSRGWVDSIHARYIDDQLFLLMKAVIQKEDINSSKAMLARLQRKLSTELGKPVQIRMTTIPVELEIISVGSGFKMEVPGQ